MSLLVGGALLLAVVAPVGLLGVPGWIRPDSDSTVDGLPDSTSIDTDGDGLSDAVEEAGWTTSAGRIHRTDPTLGDTDGDRLSDGDEAGLWVEDRNGLPVHVGLSDPQAADTDGDGLNDAVETGWPPAAGTMRLVAFEVSNPQVEDSDGDGIWDGDELFLDMDP
ncbi:hypothetical protein [Nocardioides sp. REDSEA-S30_B4]|jgi:hypothetical protein|uniref:hypothetical protein n=1 Tax=Nocardioides sp. REDSEA-S30_B4 TaxID=1811552 RepID=UPI0025DA0B4B|nr:hypothetical protein [Nocardioides sp. REDSEA-S30_B4]